MKAIAAPLVWQDGGFASDVAVIVDGDRIVRVCARADIDGETPVEDWGAVALVPGTVNAHGHAFQSLLKGYADDRRFQSWRDDVLYPFSERLDRRAIEAGALFAFAEAIVNGVTTTVDFFYLHDAGNDNAEAVIAAARRLGIRLVLARAFYDRDAATGAPARYRETAADAASRTRALAAGHAQTPTVAVQPAPHSLHACSPETIAAALEVAGDLDAPCHLHLAEARYERDDVVRRFGVPPVILLHREGLLERRLVTVHTVWVGDDELDALAAAGCAVVHCPAANAFLGDGIARVAEMLERGMRVALGADGGCANNRQSVFDEMRTASLLQKARLTDGSALPAYAAFALGTESGGDALGLPVGRIAAGYFADLVALDLEDLSLQPSGMIDRHVVHALHPRAVVRVMVGGRVVAQGGALTEVDHAEVRARITEATRGWVRP